MSRQLKARGRAAPADAPARLAAGEAVAVLEETLMAQFGIAAGDEIKLGEQTFIVAG